MAYGPSSNCVYLQSFSLHQNGNNRLLTAHVRVYEDVLYSLLSGIGLGKFCILFWGLDHSAQKLLVYIARHTGTREREKIFIWENTKKK